MEDFYLSMFTENNKKHDSIFQKLPIYVRTAHALRNGNWGLIQCMANYPGKTLLCLLYSNVYRFQYVSPDIVYNRSSMCHRGIVQTSSSDPMYG